MAERPSTNLIEGLQNTNPRLYQYLQQVNAALLQVQNDLYPLVRQLGLAASLAPPPSVPGFTYTLQTNGVRFDWTAVDGAAQYEIRKGATFDEGEQILVTSVNTAIINPIAVGTTYYTIKALSSGGIYSPDASLVAVVIPPVGGVVITSRVIDNNVLLYWTYPSTVFDISYYNIYREFTPIGELDGTFFVYFEAIGGEYDYSIEPVDIAGNVGPLTTITLQVNTPTDYVLQDYRKSIFQGEKVNCVAIFNPNLPA